MRYIVTHKLCGAWLGDITLSKPDFNRAVSRARATWPNNPVHVTEAK